MNLYLIEQNEAVGYDTYDAIVVCAESEDDAKLVKELDIGSYSSWATKLDSLIVTYLGEAKDGLERGIILESFNAG